MPPAPRLNQDWQIIVGRLGGAEAIATIARQSKGFMRAPRGCDSCRSAPLASEFAAADWVILVTSLPPEAFPLADILALYRLRRPIELA